MATGDNQDMSARLALLVPNGWFTVGMSSLRDAVLAGAASALSFAYQLLAYVRLQTRIATATDGFLDMIAGDFFGITLVRSSGQTDASFRARIISNLFRERGTRNAVIQVLTQLTGRAPIIFEPMRPADTGGYGVATGYGVAGGYGSMLLPMQSFVTAFRPIGTGIPNVAGYGVSTSGYSVPSQGEYASLSMVVGEITDADIYAAIESVRPATYIVWARIST
jgi:hypothetical protein